jgi:hydroxypyruvate isomerase
VTGRDAATLELAANVSLLFAELPYLDRFAAAAQAGFQAVESWWPFASAVPERTEVEGLLRAIGESGIPLLGLNLFAGDMEAGERGLVSRPDRQDEFRANLEVVAGIAAATGCRVFNALYGQRQPGLTEAEQDAVALENLGLAARRLGDVGGTVLVEALSVGTNGAYPITTAAGAVEVVRRAREQSGVDGIGFLFDTYHLANNGEDLLEVIRRFGGDIAHAQLADTPGRGAPGTGRLDIPAVVDALWSAGYRGAVAAEYVPAGSTAAGLGWVEGIEHLRLM